MLTLLRKSRRITLRILALLVCFYVLFCIALATMERSFLYVPFSGPTTPLDAHLLNFELRHFTTADDSQIPFWEHVDDGPILLYFHGNAGGLYAFASSLNFLAHAHFHVMAMEYRGYPGAPGRPSEKALVGDALAFYDQVRRNYPARPIVVWGYSLGSGIATQLSAARPVSALILEAPFTATVDRAAQLFPWVPVPLLMRDQYRSRDVIGTIHAPLFVMHGERDKIIPISMGKALFLMANEPKIFTAYADSDHLNLIRTPAYGDAVRFIRAAIPPAS